MPDYPEDPKGVLPAARAYHEAAAPDPRLPPLDAAVEGSRRAVQCPGCWTVNLTHVPEGGLECDCGEALTVIDLRAAPSGEDREPRWACFPPYGSLEDRIARAIADEEQNDKVRKDDRRKAARIMRLIVDRPREPSPELREKVATAIYESGLRPDPERWPDRDADPWAFAAGAVLAVLREEQGR